MKESVLGLPKGSLFPKVGKIINRIGIEIPRGRKAVCECECAGVFKEIAVLRPQMIPWLVSKGFLKAGICGRDCVFEAGLQNELLEIAVLPFGKNSDSAVKIAVFGKKSHLIDHPETIVFSEYPYLTAGVFKKAAIVPSDGATEALVEVVSQMHSLVYGVGVVETGASLQANALKIVKVIMESPVILIAKEKTPELEIFGRILAGALESEKHYLLKFNFAAASGKLEEIIKNLPAQKSPTINKLADGFFAVETVIPKKSAGGLMIRLQTEGATGILLTEINSLIA